MKRNLMMIGWLLAGSVWAQDADGYYGILNANESLIDSISNPTGTLTGDFKTDFNDPNYFDHDLTVRTRHAGPVTWFVFQMRDLFDGWLDAGNKYGFYELLAKAALEYLAGNQPEPEDAKPLLRAMLAQGFAILGVAKEHHIWPDDAMMVFHTRDDGGNQFRKIFRGQNFE